MKVYISGPVSGLANSTARANFAAAAAEIKRKGHEPVNPCLLQDVLTPSTTTWNQYMIVALALMSVCEAIVLLPGWETSKGARIEAREAMNGGMIQFNSLAAIWDAPTGGE